MVDSSLVQIDGLVLSKPVLKADYGLEKIYEVELRISGLGERTNEVALNYSKSLAENLKEGDKIYIEGEMRTLRRKEDDGTRPITIYVLANSIEYLDKDAKIERNSCILNGTLSSDVRLRKSYSNDSVDVSEFTIQVMRLHNRYSYIPATCWNNLARLSAKLVRGTKLTLNGSIQSHRTSNNRLMVEISASRISTEE